jgi:hypothetical protein
MAAEDIDPDQNMTVVAGSLRSGSLVQDRVSGLSEQAGWDTGVVT